MCGRRELAHYLTGMTRTLDFTNPERQVERVGMVDIHKKTLSTPYNDCKKLGFSKGALYSWEQNAQADKPFSSSQHAVERLMQWGIKD